MSSAKWRSLQQRHKYTYTSVVFPQSFVDAVESIPFQISSSFRFFDQLKCLISLNSTYSQLSSVKDLASAFLQLLASPAVSNGTAATAVRLYLEILFLDNSLPLHRTLISALTKCHKFLPQISDCFSSLCKLYGSSSTKGKNRFSVCRATLSFIGYPKLGFLDEALESCAVIAASNVVGGLKCVLSSIDDGSQPSPVIMEQCQEALSCIYYLLQRFPLKFVVNDEASDVYQSALVTILRVLSSSAFSRDCLVASGVAFCAAVQLIENPERLSHFISCRLFAPSSNHCHEERFNADKVVLGIDFTAELRGLLVLNRLCLLRGILTSIPRSVLNMRQHNFSCQASWTILYDGVLPELCSYCENPVDSHFNFHALTVMQICLQQIKTSLLANLTNFSGNYDPFSEDLINRLMRIIWSNLEDPLSQTVKQVHLIFDLLLDIRSFLPSAHSGIRSQLFLHQTAGDLLRIGPRCKGRCIPLASICRRLGAKSLLNLNGNLIDQTVSAYADDDVCCASTSFLKCFLEHLRDECWNDDGIEKGYNAFRELSVPPLMWGLVSGCSKLRSNLSTYAVPAVLDVDPDSIFSMLSFISIGPSLCSNDTDLTADQCVAALVSLLKVSRLLALIEGDIELDTDQSSDKKDMKQIALISVKGIVVRVPVEWFVLALVHVDDNLRADAAESLFLNPKTSSLPSSLELHLLKEMIPLNMRCSSTAFQMKWTSLFRKFFSRVRTALERHAKQGVPLNASANYTDVAYVDALRAQDLTEFMKWLSRFLFCSCYPSAPYERKTMAMELILIMIDVWPINPPQGKSCLYPYCNDVTSPDSTMSLVGAMVDSWDRLREDSFRILLMFPTPLPGISSRGSVNDMIRWAMRLVQSPRVRESDAGALTFRLLFRKYVLDLGCHVKFSGHCICFEFETKYLDGEPEDGSPIVQYISSLVDWLRMVVEEGERNLSAACKKSFVHGVLLALRYTFEELDWNSEAIQLHIYELRSLIKELLKLIVRITTLAQWVVSADAWYMPYDMEDVIDDNAIVISEDESEEDDQAETEPGDIFTVDKNKDVDRRSAERVVMVGCWLAMKEVSLLFGTIIRKIPLPSSSVLLDDNSSSHNSNGALDIGNQEVLDIFELETMGNHFLLVLLKMKHNGAIDKTRAGFTALCNRLLCSNDSRLCRMTESWMEQLMDRTISQGQTVDDLLRRSAGIPAAFIALFLAEPAGAPKRLLPRALQWLIGIARRTPPNLLSDDNVSNMHKENGNTSSKLRVEGVVPIVHAFNVLRAAFNDTNLAADTSGFSAEAMIVSIHSFSSPHWEIRNAACLAYTSLIRRMMGFLNVQKRESTRRSLTGLEFFHRYPVLHQFLYNELKIATEMLPGSMELNVVGSVHPSLCPILILLSRLKPSALSSGMDDPLDPFLLVPFIRRCAIQNNMRIRVLASRALLGLISNNNLQDVVMEIALNLPCSPMEGSNPSGVLNCADISFNSVHGLLLQLSALLDGNCRGLTDVSAKNTIIGELGHILSNCSWLGRSKFCPCPVINASYLRVLDLTLNMTNTATVRNLLLELASEASYEFSVSSPVPASIELRQQAALSCFSCISVGVSLDKLHERITSFLYDPAYEVRTAAMKRIMALLMKLTEGGKCSEDAFGQWARSYLPSLTLDRLSLEKHPKCLYYVLKIIYSLWSMQHREWGANILDDHNCDVADSCLLLTQFWDRLVHLNSGSLQAKTREIIAGCMALCIARFLLLMRGMISSGYHETEAGSFLSIFSKMNYFVDLVRTYSAPSQPVNIRRAAVEAIVASNFLKEKTHVQLSSLFVHDKSYVCLVLDVWFISIQLLEDEDAYLREQIARGIQHIIAKQSERSLCDNAVPIQVDKVIELSFSFLSSEFGGLSEYLQRLSQYVVETAASLGMRGDLVRQIFDKEIDNHHEEKLLICQLCCSSLEKLLAAAARSDRDVEALVQDGREELLHQLVASAGSSKWSSAHWFGGIGNHKDAFVPVYANLLGLFALTGQHGSMSWRSLSESRRQAYESEYRGLKQVVGPFLGNPAIRQLFAQVSRRHEKMLRFEVEGDLMEGDNSFDPYFLLRQH